MKKILVACIILSMLILVVRLAHLGPIGIKVGEEKLLAKIITASGDNLLVVSRRTDHWIDAYEVILYRTKEQTNVSVCFLGHEESYWWGCKLYQENESNVVINAYWKPIASYSLLDGMLHWVDIKRSAFPTYKVDGEQSSWPISDFVSGNFATNLDEMK